jgi:hypothetical protein
MTRALPEERFRQAAETEGGIPISAGARVAHLRKAVESGRVFYVDLSSIPESARQTVLAEIKALVERASVRTPTNEPGKSSLSIKATD